MRPQPSFRSRSWQAPMLAAAVTLVVGCTEPDTHSGMQAVESSYRHGDFYDMTAADGAPPETTAQAGSVEDKNGRTYFTAADGSRWSYIDKNYADSSSQQVRQSVSFALQGQLRDLTFECKDDDHHKPSPKETCITVQLASLVADTHMITDTTTHGFDVTTSGGLGPIAKVDIKSSHSWAKAVANAQQTTAGATVTQQVCGPCDCSLAKYKARMKVTGVWTGVGGRRWRYYFEHRMPELANPGTISVDSRHIDDPANGSPAWRRHTERYWSTPPTRTNTMVQVVAEKQEETALPPCGTVTPGEPTKQASTTPRNGCLAPGFGLDGLRPGWPGSYAGATGTELPLLGHLDHEDAVCAPAEADSTTCLWPFHAWTGLPIADRFTGDDAAIDESDGAAPEFLLGSLPSVSHEPAAPVALAGLVPVAALSRSGDAIGGLRSAVFEISGVAPPGSPDLVLQVVSDSFKVYYTVPVAPDGSVSFDVDTLGHGAADVQLLAPAAFAEAITATISPVGPVMTCPIDS